jgi:hypothetical protein
MLSELTAPPKCGTTSMRADYSLIGTARRRSGLRLDRLSDLIPYALETDWPVEAGGFKHTHFGIRSASVDHGLRLSFDVQYNQWPAMCTYGMLQQNRSTGSKMNAITMVRQPLRICVRIFRARRDSVCVRELAEAGSAKPH